MTQQTKNKSVILGAGPAGLGAALELTKNNMSVVLIEKENQVGGLARTISKDGWRFDIGPYRFFTDFLPKTRK